MDWELLQFYQVQLKLGNRAVGYLQGVGDYEADNHAQSNIIIEGMPTI